MKPYRINVKSMLTISGLISILVFALVLLVWHREDTGKIVEVLIHYGFIMLPISILWWFLEKNCWHWAWIQNYRTWLNISPDFRGRWEGTLNRVDENNPHRFVVEIRQTLTKVWIYSYSSRGVSISHIAEIGSDDSENNFSLCFLWQGDAAEIIGRNIPKSIFSGYSILHLFENENPKRLYGKYFTDRDPQTKGIVELSWVSYELQNKF
ncbi:MAG: hypothetical protein FD166_191 [Bacteroidetes bacterium]|nr:MAG: hypothetical protein FD166_191 [Bacteroidota bacterium]